MPHAFFGLTMASCIALCAFGVLPSDQFVDVVKWATILYAASTTVVTVVHRVWPVRLRKRLSNAVSEAPTFTAPSWVEPEAQHGVEFLGPFGSLRDDVFSDAIGDGLPPNYTNMIRCHGAPPATTDGADGAPVTVPTESEPSLENLSGRRPIGGAPPLDFDGVFGPKPPIPHDYNRRGDPATEEQEQEIAELLVEAGGIEAVRRRAENLASRAAAPRETPDPNVVILGDPPSKGQP